MIFISIMLITIMIMMIINYDIYINYDDIDNDNINYNVNDDNKNLKLLHFSYSCSIFNFVQNVPLPLRPSITMESRVPPNPLAGQPLTLWIGTRMGWLHRERDCGKDEVKGILYEWIG